MRKSVRIVFIGDADCGKEDALQAICDQYEEGVVSDVAGEYKLQPELSMSNTTLILNDSAFYENDKVAVIDLIRLSDVVVFCVDAGNVEMRERYFSVWSPLIQSVIPNTPIIIAAMKIDQIEEDKRENLHSFFSRAISEYGNVEVCLECSAETKFNLDQILYYAEKAIVYPVAPLLDITSSLLSSTAEAILRRVFRMFNSSFTRVMSDSELCEFQKYCFGTDLTEEGIASIHQMLEDEDAMNCTNGGITEQGFLNLMRLFILREHPETVWTVFQSVNVNDGLEYEGARFEWTKGIRYEVSMEGQTFLKNIFRAFDSDHDGLLTNENLDQMFASIPPDQRGFLLGEQHPLLQTGSPLHVETDSQGRIDPSAWLTEWQLRVHIDPSLATAALIQMGWNGTPEELVTEVTGKESDWEENGIWRSGFVHVFVVGLTAVGKTSLIRRLLHLNPSSCYVPTYGLSTSAAMIPRNRGEMGTLCLTEVSEAHRKEVLEEYGWMSDLFCVVYDTMREGAEEGVKRMLNELPEGRKVILVQTKGDLLKRTKEEETEIHAIQELANRRGLEEPLLTSCRAHDRLFPVLFDCAVFPEICVLQKEKEGRRWSSTLWTMSKMMMVMGMVVGGVFLWKKHH